MSRFRLSFLLYFGVYFSYQTTRANSELHIYSIDNDSFNKHDVIKLDSIRDFSISNNNQVAILTGKSSINFYDYIEGITLSKETLTEDSITIIKFAPKNNTLAIVYIYHANLTYHVYMYNANDTKMNEFAHLAYYVQSIAFDKNNNLLYFGISLYDKVANTGGAFILKSYTYDYDSLNNKKYKRKQKRKSRPGDNFTVSIQDTLFYSDISVSIDGKYIISLMKDNLGNNKHLKISSLNELNISNLKFIDETIYDYLEVSRDTIIVLTNERVHYFAVTNNSFRPVQEFDVNNSSYHRIIGVTENQNLLIQDSTSIDIYDNNHILINKLTIKNKKIETAKLSPDKRYLFVHTTVL